MLHRYLEEIAYDHTETYFVKIDSQQSVFLINKLKIKVLPVIFYFYNGEVKDKLIGFEEFGDAEGFKKKTLVQRLGKY